MAFSKKNYLDFTEPFWKYPALLPAEHCWLKKSLNFLMVFEICTILARQVTNTFFAIFARFSKIWFVSLAIFEGLQPKNYLDFTEPFWRYPPLFLVEHCWLKKSLDFWLVFEIWTILAWQVTNTFFAIFARFSTIWLSLMAFSPKTISISLNLFGDIHLCPLLSSAD